MAPPRRDNGRSSVTLKYVVLFFWRVLTRTRKRLPCCAHPYAQKASLHTSSSPLHVLRSAYTVSMRKRGGTSEERVRMHFSGVLCCGTALRAAHALEANECKRAHSFFYKSLWVNSERLHAVEASDRLAARGSRHVRSIGAAVSHYVHEPYECIKIAARCLSGESRCRCHCSCRWRHCCPDIGCRKSAPGITGRMRVQNGCAVSSMTA
jgi:hypothetical protein